jgi:tetratricopeptide (TPR) repeat protein
MKKLFFTVLGFFSLTIGVVSAQTVATGISDIYAERFQNAKATFEKLVAANPNDISATYWLGQTYIEMDDPTGAKSIYEKGLATSANAPLLLAGAGQVDLIQNRTNEARQKFETAITMTGGKKGNDPEVLNAVGRAIADTYTDKEKKGDINFSVQKLEEASQVKTKDNALLADIFVNLGNAYLKAKPGENGGQAFSSYQKALEANPNFALPAYRMAMLFKTQKNWELYEKYLNDAIAKDPKFGPAYYELAYFYLGKDLAKAEDYARKFAQSADSDPQNKYLEGSISYARKNYDQAITIANSIISASGDKTKARVYKLLAYSYLDKKDTLKARQYVDQYFSKAKPEDIIANDFDLKASIYSGVPGEEATVLNSYLDGIKADTVLENKLDLLKRGFFLAKKQYDKEAVLRQKIVEIKPNVNINDMFAAGLAYYRAKDYVTSYNIFKTVAVKYPDQSFGWEWKYNNAIVLDSVKKDSIALQDATALLKFAQTDTAKYSRQIINTSYFLANYALDKKDKDKAVEYLKIMRAATKDVATQESIDRNIEQLLKPPPPPRTPATKTTGTKPPTPPKTK